MLRRAVAATSRARAARARRPPRLRMEDRDAPGRILYVSPSPGSPRGGVRAIYRHVDLLNASGFDALVLHDRRGYRASWFENTTRIADDDVVRASDLLVVPEYYGARLAAFPAGVRAVVFNQGPYYTFAGMTPVEAEAYARSAMPGMLTVSEDGLALLRGAFPHTHVHFARQVIDAAVFHPADRSPSTRRIAYAANRRTLERETVLTMLRARGRIDGWELVPIRGMSEPEVAETLRGSALFLSFSELDGFGLPPAEAMACGCYVIGFDGRGGREFFDPDHCRPIEDGDLLAFVEAVEESAASYEQDPGPLRDAGRRASAAVLGRYTEEGLRGDLLRFAAALGLAPSAR